MATPEENYNKLSDEDKRILNDYHSKQINDPNHPAHPDNPKHHEFIKGLVQKFGNAALFGAGATFGSDMINKMLNH